MRKGKVSHLKTLAGFWAGMFSIVVVIVLFAVLIGGTLLFSYKMETTLVEEVTEDVSRSLEERSGRS
jgi:hypothetical protein